MANDWGADEAAVCSEDAMSNLVLIGLGDPNIFRFLDVSGFSGPIHGLY